VQIIGVKVVEFPQSGALGNENEPGIVAVVHQTHLAKIEIVHLETVVCQALMQFKALVHVLVFFS
jgi:hypothetical protein